MEALSRAGGRRQEAARLLNVTRQTLHNKILKYGLEGWDEM
jgi:DNA-binding NtrC family response regulator